MQSAEVAQEDEDDGSLGPEVTEPVLEAVGVGQGDRLEACEIHAPRLPEQRPVAQLVAGTDSLGSKIVTPDVAYVAFDVEGEPAWV